ncbi:hypothetical protein KKG46_03875 [Patescibacteria group bacterium]|nr:hypothetical protein [Patescibacteria group bacterium]
MTIKAYSLIYEIPGSSSLAHYRIEDGKLYRDSGHSAGADPWTAYCSHDGNNFYLDTFSNSMTDQPLFEKRGDSLYTGAGHPDGRGNRYYEIRGTDVYPTWDNPVCSKTSGPQFTIKGKELYKAWGHPDGTEFMAYCKQKGDKYYVDSFYHGFSRPKIFEKRGDALYTASGHPSGAGYKYFRLDGLPKDEVPAGNGKAKTPAKVAIAGKSSETGDSLIYHLLASIPSPYLFWILTIIFFSLTSYLFFKPYGDYPNALEGVILFLVSCILSFPIVITYILFQGSGEDLCAFRKTLFICFIIAAGVTGYIFNSRLADHMNGSLRYQLHILWLSGGTFILTYFMAITIAYGLALIKYHYIDEKKEAN